jgi:hypothetical protein
MPIFQYDPYRNAYGPSIAEALAHANDAPAQAALRIGDLQAQGAERTAALQGQLWNQLGNIPAQIQASNEAAQKLALQKQAGQLQAQQLQEGALTLQDKQAQQAAAARFGQNLASTPKKANGLYDVKALAANVPGADLQYVQPLLDRVDGINTSWANADAADQGKLQRGALTVWQAGSDPVLTQHLLDTGHRDGTIPDDLYTAFTQKLAADPTQATPILKWAAGPQKDLTVGADQRIVTGGPDHAVVVPAEGKPGEGEYTLGDQRYNAQHQPVGPQATAPLTGEDRIASLIGREAGGETLTAADKALLEGWKAKEGLKPFTVKTVVNGRDVEQVMTTADAMKQGYFAVPPPKDTPGGAQKIADIKAAVLGMKNGTQAPILPGRGTDAYIALVGEAERQGFDMAKAATDWQATQRYLASANAAPQLKLRQSINALPGMLDTVETLAKQWDGGQFPVLNRANLAAAKNGVYGDAAASLARRLDAQIADVSSDLGAVYMGGNSPTDEALKLAQKALGEDWSKQVLLDSVQLARENVKTRSNSIRTTGVAGASDDNPYDRANRTTAAPADAVAAPPAPPKGALRTVNGETRVWDGARWQPVTAK